jgi:hypothetical protein
MFVILVIMTTDVVNTIVASDGRNVNYLAAAHVFNDSAAYPRVTNFDYFRLASWPNWFVRTFGNKLQCIIIGRY